MDVRSLLIVGIHNDLVDQFDQLVVGCGGHFVAGAGTAFFAGFFVEVRQQVINRTEAGGCAVKKVQGRGKFAPGADLVNQFVFGKDVADHASNP